MPWILISWRVGIIKMVESSGSTDNYINIYESALEEWGKQSFDRSIELFGESLKAAQTKGDKFFANKALNEIEIRQEKTYLYSFPRVAHVTLTSRCNMRCPFCYLDRYQDSKDMPREHCLEIIKLFPYLQHLTWQGGEAFLHSSFKEMILESINFPNFEQTLLTNGLFLDGEWLDLFQKIPKFTIVISLESIKKETYEELRKGGSFEKLVSNIRLINSLGEKNNHRFNLLLNIILMKRNYQEIEEMVDFAIENKFNHVMLTSLYANGSEFYNQEYLSPDESRVREYFSALMPKVTEKAKKNNLYLDDRFTGTGKAGAPSSGQGAICFSPWQQLFIESTGEVKSYCSCVHTLGNLKNNSIKDIWNGEKVIELRKNIIGRDYSSCNPACVEGLLDQNNLKLIYRRNKDGKCCAG